MNKVARLSVNEVILLDSDKLVDLCATLGEAGAEARVSQTMISLAHGVTGIEDAYVAQDLKLLTKRVEELTALADGIGMSTFVEVAADVIGCAKSAQMVPLAATLTRLMRIADKSISAVWDMENMSL